MSSTCDILIARFESCIAVIANILKLNDDKTEFMQFLPLAGTNKSADPDPVIQIGTD